MINDIKKIKEKEMTSPSEERRQRIENEGRQAKIEGKKIIDNPYLVCGFKGRIYAGFWDKGFNKND